MYSDHLYFHSGLKGAETFTTEAIYPEYEAQKKYWRLSPDAMEQVLSLPSPSFYCPPSSVFPGRPFHFPTRPPVFYGVPGYYLGKNFGNYCQMHILRK